MERRPALASRLLKFGIAANLVLLGYYKYANFFVRSVDAVAGTHWNPGHIVLPLAISFFTFQQIAYLIESRKDGRAADSFLDYALFVLFFPHLIAGPITHHKEMLPQFAAMGKAPIPRSHITVGTAILIMGMFKKVVLADTFALIANPVFTAARWGDPVTMVQGWAGALGYTLQLYFDFSGYSDMAIGLGLLFGILMPVNFASPYKSTSIIEFWRRWHISLSRFLRNYLYIGLGGNRRGPVRRHLNLLATMVLGGLWHGAGWTFVAWGALHGSFLIINHFWRSLAGRYEGRLASVVGWAVTMVAVVVGWVLFRADTFDSAVAVLRSMAGLGPHAAPGFLIAPHASWIAIAIGTAIVVALPNALELARYPWSTPGLPIEHDYIVPVRRQPGPMLAAAGLGALAACALVRLPDPGVFLYFNF
jgi:D-alanyl-lipoteichoic acid acyltransferase DltB (MBOAT superfamily)